MTVRIAQIKWGSYKDFEGPWFPGSIDYNLPDTPDFLDKVVYVVTSTEGGHYNSVNMYDSCILTVGTIQFCEKLMLVTNMLGECANTDLATIKSYLSQLPIPADFHKNMRNQWRICCDTYGDIDNPDKMRQLYLCGANGLKGQWKNQQIDQARTVASVFASMWDSQSMQDGQMRFVKQRIMSFVMPRTKQIIFADPTSNDGYDGALKAAVVSFSVNIPAVADKLVNQAAQDPAWSSASSQDKFTMAMKILAFKSNIAIWPGRYKTIHPALEKVFGVSLPSLDELASDGDNTEPSDDSLTTPVGIQKALLALGYDIGPRGADGSIGPKTQQAIIAFQGSHNLDPDGAVGTMTIAALQEALKNTTDGSE
jgi:murein L,D-transpeptidase YcbB/YkuD